MRTIKFRYKLLDDEERIKYVIFTIEELENGTFQRITRDMEIKSKDEYTGLKDKNGVEIYEGDIIKYQGCFSFHYDDKDEMIEEVRFVDGAFSPVYLSERDLHSYDDELMVVEDIEVIGNIYENPELLK